MAILRCPIEIQYPGSGGPAANVWHLRVDDANPLQEATLLAAALRDFYASFAPDYAPGVTVDIGAVIDVDSREAYTVPFAQVVSTSTAPAAPPHLAVCITWLTSVRARRAMGRTFLGPLNQAWLGDDGTVEDGYLAAVRTRAETLIGVSEQLENGAIGVYGYQNAVPAGMSRGLDDPRVIRDITDLKVRDTFAVRRSRRD